PSPARWCSVGSFTQLTSFWSRSFSGGIAGLLKPDAGLFTAVGVCYGGCFF
ncbi:hypothetical protein A2U01_0108368, partial [Trifolium medium]|nr:hypothetical protein [Trifolium medium]